MPEVLLVVDLDDVMERFRRQTVPLSPESLSQGLRRAALVLGSPVHALAYSGTTVDDGHGAPMLDRPVAPAVFEGFTLHRIEGTRDQLRCEMARRARQHCDSPLIAGESSLPRPICVLVT